MTQHKVIQRVYSMINQEKKKDRQTTETMSCFAPNEKRKKKLGPAQIHCRNCLYDGTGPERAYVSLNKLPWSRPYLEYMPIQYTSCEVLRQPSWADPPMDAPRISPMAFNRLNPDVDRRSYVGVYKLQEGVPKNPIGRTGIIGRGVLGRWGPNHTATPLITRWSRGLSGEVRCVEENRVLEVLALQTRVGWSLPCELVTPLDKLGLGTRRAFLAELVRHKSFKAAEEVNKALSALFEGGTLIYQGYVDDAKNTDNAWLETTANNYHDEEGDKYGSYTLAEDFTWVEVHSNLNMFSQHKDLLSQVASLHRTHW